MTDVNASTFEISAVFTDILYSQYAITTHLYQLADNFDEGYMLRP